MAKITTTTADVFLPEKWSTDLMRATEAKLVLANLVHDYSSEVTADGKQIHVNNLSNLAANDKVAGVKVSFQAITETGVDIDLNIHKEASFLVEDIVKIQSSIDLNKEYTQKAGYALGKATDLSLAGLASGFSQTKGTYNTAITTDVILDSILLLDDADVPEDDRHFVFKPKVKRDIIDITTYISNDFVDGRPVVSGMIGSLYGVATYMTTNIVKTGDNTNNMLFHRDALGIARQKLPTTNADYSVEDIAWRVVSDTVYGVNEMRNDHGVLVKT